MIGCINTPRHPPSQNPAQVPARAASFSKFDAIGKLDRAVVDII